MNKPLSLDNTKTLEILIKIGPVTNNSFSLNQPFEKVTESSFILVLLTILRSILLIPCSIHLNTSMSKINESLMKNNVPKNEISKEPNQTREPSVTCNYI